MFLWHTWRFGQSAGGPAIAGDMEPTGQVKKERLTFEALGQFWVRINEVNMIKFVQKKSDFMCIFRKKKWELLEKIVAR